MQVDHSSLRMCTLTRAGLNCCPMLLLGVSATELGGGSTKRLSVDLALLVYMQLFRVSAVLINKN
jgi:hypothetical protein